MSIVRCNNLHKIFPVTRGLLKEERGVVKAVDGVTFSIEKGETFGLVGESASGKTTLGKLILGILKPDLGSVELLTDRKQVIFQDPFNSLDPKMRVGEIISEGLVVKSQGHKVTRSQAKFIDSKETLSALARIALRHAEAGVDWVAPSAMAKGQVKAIRKALDKNGLPKVKILGYSAKFASNFYGPFRNAANSAPAFGDRSAYQLDYSKASQALDEIETDIKEGADMVMVKPALSYLDIIKEAKTKFDYPTAAYNVSGEYAFVKYGAKQGLWNEREMVKEIITSIKRAGADFIISYHAKDIAKWQK